MSLSCFIIDDEPLAIEVIESHISKIDGLEVEATFQNAVKAFQALRDSEIDVIFLDIQMPKLTGIEFLKTIKNSPKVVFTTAYREYALEGFELDVVDYLLKPISFDRFLKAIDKIFEMNSSFDQSSISKSDESSNQFVFVPVDKKHVKICLNEILFVESKRDYVLIKTLSKEVVTHQTLIYMEERLPQSMFLRVHRSFIINTKMIESWSNNEIELPEMQVPIGRTYKREALKVLNSNSELL